ncbi:hypothetical protein D3C76_1703960 [compost metagenome]
MRPLLDQQILVHIACRLKVIEEIRLLNAFIEPRFECPVGQGDLQVRQLLVHIARKLLDLPLMLVQQLLLDLSLHNKIRASTQQETGNTGYK